jgi:hypothetical protein
MWFGILSNDCCCNRQSVFNLVNITIKIPCRLKTNKRRIGTDVGEMDATKLNHCVLVLT